MRRPLLLLATLATMFVVAGGVVHLCEWAETYRHVPASAPGAFVVQQGFLAHALAAVLIGAALLVLAWRRPKGGWVVATALAGIALQAATVTGLFLSRNAGVFGWRESGWSTGATQSLAVALDALALLVILLAVSLPVRKGGSASREHGAQDLRFRPADALPGRAGH